MITESGKHSIQKIAAAVYARRKALADLMHSRALSAGDISDAVRQITETAAQNLEVERASVWKLIDDGSAIECLDLYERSHGRHTAGTIIRAANAPRYFEALQQERSLSAHDARRDPRTSEFTPGYLDPNGITAMLDAPVFVRGRMVGVVCHEHVGSSRHWEFAEELLAGTFADFVALVIETAEWQRADQALRDERDSLEAKVEQRTAELKASESRLRELATRDALTGTYNRRYLEELLRTEAERADRYDRPLTVAMVDVDHFKRINDTYGHPVGDEVLRVIVDRCQKAIRISDALGRFGGEEFVLVLPETALVDARIVADRVRESVAGALIVVGDRALPVTVSIGLASLKDKEKCEALLARADAALYSAKESGRNRLALAEA